MDNLIEGETLKAGVMSRTDKPEALAIAVGIIEHLEAKGMDVLVESETAIALELSRGNSELGEMDADFMVIVGGDGTILRAAMLLMNPETPILGVNLGRRGFLTEVYPNGVQQALERVLEGNYHLEESIKLSSRCFGLDEVFPDSLNEVMVASALPSKVLDVSLSVDDEHIIDIQADGVLVATPTGSTAYNLSAGGSIMAPELPAMILTAVSPYSYFRSIVAPLSSRIKIEMLKPKADALAIIDGRVYAALKPTSIIEVWASSHKARFIRFGSFYKRLRRRLIFQHDQNP